MLKADFLDKGFTVADIDGTAFNNSLYQYGLITTKAYETYIQNTKNKN